MGFGRWVVQRVWSDDLVRWFQAAAATAVVVWSDGLVRWFQAAAATAVAVWSEGLVRRQQQQQQRGFSYGRVSVVCRGSNLQQKHNRCSRDKREHSGDFDMRDALTAQEEDQEEREDRVQRERAVGGADKIGGRMPRVRQMAVSDVQREKEII
jgi:hypothetical protein